MEILPLPLRLHTSGTTLTLFRCNPLPSTPGPLSLPDYQYGIRTTGLFLPPPETDWVRNGVHYGWRHSRPIQSSNPPPPSVSPSQTTNVQSGIIYAPGKPSSPSPSVSGSFNQSINETVVQHSHPPSTTTEKNTPFVPGVSRRGLNLLAKIGIAIAVIVVSLVILIGVYKAFKKASHNNNANDLGTGTDIRQYAAGQLANTGGKSLEVGITDIRTHIVQDPDTLKVSVIDSRTHIVQEPDSLGAGIDIRTYTREELANATHNFTTKIGQGVSGFVYRANLPGNRIGAVKRATDLDPQLFRQELSVLLRLPRHPHLVDLIGLCLQPGAGDAGERILVFEFISNGNLYDRLHKNKNKGLSTPLSWAARMDIAYQVAVALQYLHEEASPPILHRDVKSANVLLVDDNYAKLADFGLSKLGPKHNQFTVTAVRGSYGYMDPQYVKTRRYSAKSDVYSFGVLLLELITGLKSLHDDTPLAEWTQTHRSEGTDKFITIVDPDIIHHINMREVQNMIKIANLCLRESSEERSSMREIMDMLQETRNINGNGNGNLSEGGEAASPGNGNISDATALLN